MVWRSLAVALLIAGAASCAQDPDVAKREDFAKGDKYFSEGKYAEAIILYRSALQHDPRFGEARYKLADAYVKTEDYAKAIGEYVRAADLLPARDEAQIKAGNMRLLAGQFEDARSRAMKVLLELAKGRAGQAESAFKRATDANPTSVPAQLALANFYWATRRVTGASLPLDRPGR